MKSVISWGILGTGNIASIFAKDLKYAEKAKLLAVGSRTQVNADQFGDRFNIERRYSSYSELADDPEVDVIYIATPHTFHYENVLLCLKHEKAVLCEKPFMVNHKQAVEVINLARKKKLFIMEAMWTRFLPLMKKLQQIIQNGEIGKLTALHADFCFYNSFDKGSRLFNPQLAGGALLDVGIYPVMLAHILLGKPDTIKAHARIGKTEVDETTSAIFGYDDGRVATFQSSINYSAPTEAILSGTEGFIKIHSRWFAMPKLSIHKKGQDPVVVELPFKGRGFHFEINETQDCIRKGKTESAVMPHHDTLDILKTLDRIRNEIDLVYPFE